MELQDLVWTPGSSNPSGIGSRIFIVKKSGVSAVPAYGAAGAAALEAGDITMLDVNIFNELYSTQGKAKFDFESIGEKDAKLFKVWVELSYPDIDDAAKALVMSILNDNCIILVPTLIAGESQPKYVMIGGHTYDTEIDAKGTSGDAPGSSKGLSLTVTSFDIVPGKTYVGAIEITGGSLDLSTGVFTPGA